MGWKSRLRIAVGVIKGLQYLHFGCYPQVLHYNVKPSNVMLDVEFRARLTDCGLAKLAPDSSQTACYNSPECLQNSSSSGKRQAEDHGEMAKASSPDRGVKEALDKSILGEEVEEDEMVMAVRIAVVCLSELPPDRPSSDELGLMLTQLHSY
ncbi:hypothetical protein MLD38_017083 [Melastoma candidum]|uniref:Uncharacterized protein n=1 Tax=Melastoma candidum TaxID=119954 RepID=A0ACB9QNR2_9MYRT|nr:hypothetical protein MLD38_017083 [Melastoma candidum]